MNDLGAIVEKWLQMCPCCDAGLPANCVCPDLSRDDYRPVMSALVDEIEQLRKAVSA
jgi:hypothetical protein